MLFVLHCMLRRIFGVPRKVHESPNLQAYQKWKHVPRTHKTQAKEMFALRQTNNFAKVNGKEKLGETSARKA